MIFSEALQDYRKKAGMSQEELAHQLGVSRQSISKWEQGQAFPETEKLIQLSRMLGVTIDSLLKEELEVQVLPDTQTPQPRKPSFLQKPVWIFAAVLAALLVIVLLTQLRQPVAVTEPVSSLQAWFFDFSRDYHLEALPSFQKPQAFSFVNWAYTMSGSTDLELQRATLDALMTQYFGTSPTAAEHTSLPRRWQYDKSAELYRLEEQPSSIRPFYLLKGLTLQEHYIEIEAIRYEAPFSPTDDTDRLLRDHLLAGDLSQMTPHSAVSLRLMFTSDGTPQFLSHSFQILSSVK